MPKRSDQVIQSDVEERVLEAGAIAQIAANSELPIALGQKGTSIGLSEYVGQEPRQPRYGSGIIAALNEPPADARLAPNFGLCGARPSVGRMAALDCTESVSSGALVGLQANYSRQCRPCCRDRPRGRVRTSQ